MAALILGLAIGAVRGFSRGTASPLKVDTERQKLRMRKIFGIIGSILLLVGLGSAIKTKIFIQHASEADGVVVLMIERSGGSGGGHSYAPSFMFHDTSGTLHTVQSKLSSSAPEFKVGDKIKVLFEPGAPDTAAINTFWQLWFTPVFFSLFGIALPILARVITRFQGGRRYF